MKILIDARFLGTPTGIGRYIENLVLEFEKQDNDNEYIVLVGKEGRNKWEPKNPKFKKRFLSVRWYTFREQFSLLRILKEEKPNLAHFPHWNICYFWKGPFVVTIHDLILLEFPTRRASTLGATLYWVKYKILFPLVLRKAIYKSRKIIVPSNYVKQDITKNFPKVNQEKIKVIYEGISLINTKPEASNPKLQFPNHPFLLYVGNVLPHKNLEFLIRVFKKLKAAGEPIYTKDLKLMLVGESSYFYDRLKNYVKKLGLLDEVIFTGRITDEELAAFYKNARAYVFPSLLEGFGLPPLEAMANGLPVIAADSSCLPEILGNAAMYFNPKNDQELMLKIQEILGNNSLRNELIAKGHAQIMKYSWNETARKTLKAYY